MKWFSIIELVIPTVIKKVYQKGIVCEAYKTQYRGVRDKTNRECGVMKVVLNRFDTVVFNPLGQYFKSFQPGVFWLMVISLLGLIACQSKPMYQAYTGETKPDNDIATFIVPDEFELLYVDGKSYSQSFLIDGVIVKMLPGKHQIVVKYDRIWDIPPDSHEKVVSQPLRLSFTASAGNTYSIGFKELQELKEAKVFAKKPTVHVSDLTNKQIVPTEIKYQLSDESFLASFISNSTSNDNLNNKNAQEPLSSEDLASDVQPPQVKAGEKDTRALEMLKYWWQQADPQQQNDFMRWLEK